MSIKSSQTLVKEALSEITTISPSEALEKLNKNECNLIDIRDANELQSLGTIENSINISRGLFKSYLQINVLFYILILLQYARRPRILWTRINDVEGK